MMTESGRDAIERGVVRATGSDAIDIGTDHGHATDAEMTTETRDGGITQEAATISDGRTTQNADEIAMWMTGGQGRDPKTADAIETLGAGRHTRGRRDEKTEPCLLHRQVLRSLPASDSRNLYDALANEQNWAID